MSTILAALRRAEQDRRRQPLDEPLLPILPGGPLLSRDSVVSALSGQRWRRCWRLGFPLLLFVLGASGMWLSLRQGVELSSPATALPTSPSLQGRIAITDTSAISHVVTAPVAVGLSSADGDVTLMQPQVLRFPRLETELISAAQLVSGPSAAVERWGLPPSIGGAEWDDAWISAEDILPTPPLPTDPVRRPSSAKSATQAVTESAMTINRLTRGDGNPGDQALTLPSKLDLRGVSPELAQAFRSALQDKSVAEQGTERLPRVGSSSSTPRQSATMTRDLPQLRQLPSARRALIPALRFEVHNYVSAVDKRWVRINGQRYRSGAQLANEVQLVRIEPEQIVLAVKGQQAILPALQDWPGRG